MTGAPVARKLWFPAFEPEVDHALFLLGHRNLLSTGLGQIALTGLVALTSYQRTETVTLSLWLGLLVLAGLSYMWLYWHFQPEVSLPSPNVAGVKRWQRYRRSLQFCSAVGWGWMAWLMVPGATVQNAILLSVFTGVVGHAAAGNSANDFLGVVISAITTVLIFIWHIPAIFGDEAIPLMLMLMLYVVVLISSLGNTHRGLRRSIHLQLENKALAISNAQQAARAEKANRDKSEFLAAASHDLRQPVHALLLLVEAYRQQVPGAREHPLMQHITQAGQSINGLFNALMELSRLESGTEKPTLAEFDLQDALQQVMAHSLPEAQAKGLHLRSYLAPGLRTLRLATDPVLFQRIVANLLSNALRYTPRGGVLLALRRAHTDGCVQGQAPADGVWLEVWDTGVGIAQADQSRIFDPYVQMGNRERDRSQGLGLGLAIVRHACELLGLTVSVASVPGRGTRFRLAVPGRLIVPAARLPSATSAAPGPDPSLACGGVWLRRRRVLLVDDDPLVQVAMQALLKGWQIDVRAATRGDATVLEVCGPAWIPECILCDFRLPGTMNGIELLDFLQQAFPQSMGVLLTGEMVQTVQQAAEDAGYLLLSKPVDAAVLASTLGALLERRHEERMP
ncbi:MAG: hybrid sensor histidine kinase/response regulator [Rhodoferax sp.]|nr:hybrid sensor histidine kinase/response regulator [Rhodoferax sp.]